MKSTKKSPFQGFFTKNDLRRPAVAAIAAGAALLLLAGLLLGVRSCTAKPPVDPDTVTTTTVGAVTTSTTKKTTAPTTAATIPPTTTTTVTTTVATTTTTEAPLTTTTAPAPLPSDYPGDGTWNLLLVNGWNPLAEAVVRDQSNLQWYAGSESVDYRITQALSDMLEAGSQYGLWVTSGYRSYDLQTRLYNNEVAEWESYGYSHEEALDKAATVVARPGTSEHHTGLAVDLLHDECWDLVEEWEDSEAFDWMMDNCYKYGFILRYPKEKEAITGVIYEPWHYRYVGVEAATYIMQNGITLEEYLQ